MERLRNLIYDLNGYEVYYMPDDSTLGFSVDKFFIFGRRPRKTKTFYPWRWHITPVSKRQTNDKSRFPIFKGCVVVWIVDPQYTFLGIPPWWVSREVSPGVADLEKFLQAYSLSFLRFSSKNSWYFYMNSLKITSKVH